MKIDKSKTYFQQARAVIPGGVNSPVRACRSVELDPLFIDRADGSRVYDVDGNEYIDYVASWGPMILGHRHPAVIQAIGDMLEKGTSFGAPTMIETQLAETIIKAVPSVEKIRMVNSGTEATMSAIRAARAYTKRDLIVKFDGNYHGHADTLLVAAGSGVATLGIPGSPGVPQDFVDKTLSLPYNDVVRFTELMEKRGDQIACVIVEPVAGNMGMVLPDKDFLEALREGTKKSGSVLIFDEVITGFRVSYGGAQSYYGVIPDITCLGKIIGGGMPVGAYGGKKEIMESMAPEGPVYQAGTLSGNPIAMAAGLATLEQLQNPKVYEDLEKTSDALITGLADAADNAGLPVTTGRVGSLMGLFFTGGPVKNIDDAKKSDLALFSAFYRGLREKGIYIAPSQFESMFVSLAHTMEDIEKTVETARAVMKNIKK